jgi:hypothetical protein
MALIKGAGVTAKAFYAFVLTPPARVIFKKSVSFCTENKRIALTGGLVQRSAPKAARRIGEVRRLRPWIGPHCIFLSSSVC